MTPLCDGCGKDIYGGITQMTITDRDVRSTYTLCNDLHCRLTLFRRLSTITEQNICRQESKAKAQEVRVESTLPEIKRLAPNILSHRCDVVLILDTGEVMVNGKVSPKSKKE